jgi:hypothetical protein
MIGLPVMFAGVDCFSGPLLPTARQPRKEFGFNVKMDRTSGGQLQRPNRTFRATRDDAAIDRELLPAFLKDWSNG